MTSSVTGPRRSSKVLPQAKLAPKKCRHSCLVVCCHSDPLGLPEFQQNHYIWEVCLTNQWDGPKPTMPAASIGQQKGPGSSARQCLTARPTASASRVERIGLYGFASSSIFTWSVIFKHLNNLAVKMFPLPAGGRKCFPRVCRIPKHRFLCYRNKQT